MKRKSKILVLTVTVMLSMLAVERGKGQEVSGGLEAAMNMLEE